jgi:hypothetical protein
MAILIPAALLMRGRHHAVGAKSAPLQLNFFWHPGFKYMLIWAFLTSKLDGWNGVQWVGSLADMQ